MWFLLNQSVLAKAMLARVLLLQGKIAQSRSLAAECLEEAQREKDKLAIALRAAERRVPHCADDA